MPMSRLFAGTLVRSCAAHRDGARGRLVQAGQDAQRRRLAAARRAEQRDELARLDVQGQPVEGLDRAVDPGQVVQFDGNPVRHVGTPGWVAGVGGLRRTARSDRGCCDACRG